MIDVNAVREGTRWTYLRREVEVDEVSARFVVFREPNGLAEVAPLPKFLAGAHDPGLFEYNATLDDLEMCAVTPADWESGKQERVVRDAVIHILRRLGPPAPLNVVPPAPAKPEPVALPSEPDPESEVHSVVEPDVRLSISPNDTLLAPYSKRRSKPGSSLVA